MSYYLRLQRQSEGYAARVFQELYPVTAERRSAAKFLADIIRHVATVSSAWAITLNPRSIRVNIGPARLFHFWEERIWFTTTAGKVGRAPSWLEDLTNSKFVYRSIRVPSRQYIVRASHLGLLPAALKAVIFAYIEAAAAGRTRSAWHKAHSPGVVRFLESYLHIELPAPTTFMPPTYDPLDEIGAQAALTEGAVIRVTRNAYERNPAARPACLAHYGHRCFACNISLSERYGQIATDVIHVHHLVPLSQIKHTYRIDPIRDLLPLCPNCHSVAHLQRPPIAPAKLRAMVESVADRRRPTPARS